jgi:hypothetical protein
MSEPMHRGRHNLPAGDAHNANGAGADADAEEQDELLLLALLERLHSDYAAGRHPDLAAYCAANPRLEDAFLALALAMHPPEKDEESDPSSRADSARQERPLSPGVLRALGGIPDFAGDAYDLMPGKRPERQVAEEPTAYSLKTHAPDTSKGDC